MLTVNSILQVGVGDAAAQVNNGTGKKIVRMDKSWD